MRGPVFLVAARRSGTTLIRLMLNGHPAATWHRGWEQVADAIGNLTHCSNGPKVVRLEDFEDFSVTTRDELKSTLDNKIARLLADQTKQVFGATCHVGFKAMPQVWPNAKYIHLIRDPRDIAISHMKLGWAGHYYFAAEAWVEAERDWDTLSERLSDDQYIELKYEDLVETPETELRRICEFLSIDYTEKLFDYVNTSNYSHPKKELAYRWREQLTEEQALQVESQIRSLITSRGYETSPGERRYSGIQVAQFKLSNTRTKRMKRIKENGLLHVLMDKLARDLNLKFLKKRIAKADAIRREQHLSSLEKDY
jgi:hypothetical protein